MRDSTDWNGERVALERSSMRRVTVLKNALFVSVGVVSVGVGVVRRGEWWHVMVEDSWAC